MNYAYYSNNGHGGTLTGPRSATGPFSLIAANRLAASEFDATSDARIKRVKGHSDADRDLNTLMGLEITDYTMRDTIANGQKPYKKVIAQQVEKVYPQAVSKTTGVIPDIYQKAAVQKGWIRLATNLKSGEQVKIITEGKQAVYDVLEADASGFWVALPDATQAFVYGREVKDLRTVDYDAIAMLNVSATQALHGKITRLEAENAALRQQNETTNARLQRIERTFALLTDPQRHTARQVRPQA